MGHRFALEGRVFVRGSRADLLVRQNGEAWCPLSESQYWNEAALRDLLAAQPDLIPSLSAQAVEVTDSLPHAPERSMWRRKPGRRDRLVECELASSLTSGVAADTRCLLLADRFERLHAWGLRDTPGANPVRTLPSGFRVFPCPHQSSRMIASSAGHSKCVGHRRWEPLTVDRGRV